MVQKLIIFVAAISLLTSCENFKWKELIGKGETQQDTIVKVVKEEAPEKAPAAKEDFSWLATSRISKTDLDARGYAKADYRILRNAIYARHGYIFKSADLTEYFSSFSWYEPRYSDVTSKLSSIERANVATLKKLEGGSVKKNVPKTVTPTVDPGYDLSQEEMDNPYLWLSQSKYSISDFYQMAPDRATLRIWRNAIYARHGYIFKSADLTAHFSRYEWYNPYRKIVDSSLSSVEIHNIRTLKQAYDNW